MKTVDQKTSSRSLWKRMWRHRVSYLMILPPIVTVFIFHYIPIYGVQIAFKDFSSRLGIWGSKWVGLKHFRAFVNHPFFPRIMWNTFWLNVVSLILWPSSIIFAILLNEMRSLKLKKTCQMLTYAPYFVSTVVACSMCRMFLNRGGLFNIAGDILGFEYVNLLSSAKAFPWINAVVDLWRGLGWGTIIYLSALAGVSGELVEAARVDGATRLQVIWHVNLPHLKPTIITLLILRMGSMLSSGFEQIYLLQTPLNLDASTVISTYVYETGLVSQQFSYSSAIGLFNNIINIVLILAANTISKKVSETSLW